MLSVPQMLWLVDHARENDSRCSWLAIALSTQVGRTRGRAPHSRTIRHDPVRRLLQTQRQKVPALKAAIEDLKAGRLHAGWEKLEKYGVIK